MQTRVTRISLQIFFLFNKVGKAFVIPVRVLVEQSILIAP